MFMKLLGMTLLSATLALAFIAAQGHATAAAITLFNTGVDGAGVPLANGPLSIDPHYVISLNPDVLAGADGLTHLPDETAYPIVAGPWVANTLTAKWVGPRFNNIAGSAPGLYRYTTTFTLPPGAVLSSATISGLWAFDDGGSNPADGGIFLNGIEVLSAENPGYNSLTAFTIPAGSPFLAGANTLAFQGTNDCCPTALMVDGLAGTVDVIPEPGSLALLAAAVVGLASRRKRQARV